MSEIFILGASGHGKVVAETAIACGYKIKGFIDKEPTRVVFGLPTLSEESFLSQYSNFPVALGIGSNIIREKLYLDFSRQGVTFPVLIHPSAHISPSATLEEATVVLPQAIIHTEAIIGQGVIINSGAIIEHDNHIGDFAHISPGCAIAGDVHIGRLTHIGIGATIIQGMRIGANSIIGAGSTVIYDIPSNTTAVGTPAKVIKHHE